MNKKRFDDKYDLQAFVIVGCAIVMGLCLIGAVALHLLFPVAS